MNKLLPFEPTSDMYNGLANLLMIGIENNNLKTSRMLHKYLEFHHVQIPAWLKEELPDNKDDHYLTSATRSVLIYKAMYHDYKEQQ